MTPLHLLHHDDSKKVQHDFFGHVRPMASSTVMLYLFTQYYQIEVQHNSLDLVMPLMLVPVSDDTDGVINGTFHLLSHGDY